MFHSTLSRVGSKSAFIALITVDQLRGEQDRGNRQARLRVISAPSSCHGSSTRAQGVGTYPPSLRSAILSWMPVTSRCAAHLNGAAAPDVRRARNMVGGTNVHLADRRPPCPCRSGQS